jgi:hypothetical protein
MLLGGFVVLFGMGILLIWRQPVTAEAVAVPTPPLKNEASERKSARKKAGVVVAPQAPPATPAKVAPAPPQVSAPAPVAAVATATTSVATVAREVENSLDGLKDKLFRLELRRQAGTVSEDDYVRERAEAEKVLRDLVGR